MAWIKTHPHLLFLIVVAVAVLAGSGFVVKSAMDFDNKFNVVRQVVPKGTQVYVQEQTPIEKANSEFQKPAQWSVPKNGYSLFTSVPLMVVNGVLQPPEGGSEQTYTLKKEPIPNQWFFDNNFSPFKKGVNREDPDGDGFWNEDEWAHKTDPNVKTSHPPYLTKLFFFKYIKVSFFLRFQTVNGDPAKPETLDFQINTTAMGRGSVFLKLGQVVETPKAKFKIEKFEAKMAVSPNGTEIDVSELTLVNIETGVPIVLVLNKPTDSPESYAHFHYLWPDPFKPKDLSVQKSKEFALPQEPEVKYKLLDIDDTKAVLQLPSGEKLEIFPAPPGYP
jgi:hypothetical protein